MFSTRTETLWGLLAKPNSWTASSKPSIFGRATLTSGLPSFPCNGTWRLAWDSDGYRNMSETTSSTLRTDPVFKLIADRSPDDADLASQPTLSRFENQIDIPSLNRLRDVFIDQFIASFAQPPITLTFDLDAVDDPTHGSQQLTLFHGFYEQYQYLPLVITCAENDQIVMLSLRHGTARLPWVPTTTWNTW